MVKVGKKFGWRNSLSYSSTLQPLEYVKRKSTTYEIPSTLVFSKVHQTPKFHQQMYFVLKVFKTTLLSVPVLFMLWEDTLHTEA